MRTLWVFQKFTSMPLSRKLTNKERKQLENLCEVESARISIRAEIVLEAARGKADKQIAEEHYAARETVRRWRRRFEAEGIECLVKDRPRKGRTRKVDSQMQESVVKAANEPGRPSVRQLASRFGLGTGSVHRILSARGHERE